MKNKKLKSGLHCLIVKGQFKGCLCVIQYKEKNKYLVEVFEQHKMRVLISPKKLQVYKVMQPKILKPYKGQLLTVADPIYRGIIFRYVCHDNGSAILEQINSIDLPLKIRSLYINLKPIS